MYFKILLFIIIFAFSPIANSQDEKKDSLNNYKFMEKKIYEYFAKGDEEKAQYFAYKYLKKAKLENNNSLFHIKGHDFVAGVTSDDIALAHLDSIAIICEKEGSFGQSHIRSYISKGAIYFDIKRNFKKSLDNYIKALELAEVQKDERMVAVIKNALGVIKLENMGKEEEALSLIKDAESFYIKPYNKVKYLSAYLSVLFSLSSTYIRLNNLDMASKYNQLGLEQAKKYDKPESAYYFYLNEGIVHFLNGNFLQSVGLVQKGETYFENINDFGNLIEMHYYLGSSFKKMGKIEEALFHLEKLDSIQEKNSFYSLQGRKGLEVLIDHYKEKNQPLKELIYVNKLLSLDSIYLNDYISISSAVSNKYDNKNLLNEKSILEHKLIVTSKKSSFKSLILIGLSIIVISIFYYFRQKQKSLKRKFDDLLNHKNKEDKHSPIDRKKLGISDVIVKEILSNLKKFEQNQGFLKSDLNSQQFAKIINTNTKYLSQVINAKKEKSIINYINDLRIDHAIERLKNDQLFRKYSIRSIAEEVGFSNPTSFAQSFYKHTNLKPSYFIKELIRSANS